VRDFKAFIKDITHKPPYLFPWVALFHLVMLFYSIWNFRTEPFPSLGWIQPLWMLGYTVFWFFVCDMRKWAAYGYLGLTMLNLILYFSLKNSLDSALYVSSLFLVDVFFSFFILFFFRRFE